MAASLWLTSLLAAIGAVPHDSPSVSLAWDPSPDGDIIAYRVYYGVATRHYAKMISIGSSTTITISDLVEGVTYFFAVTAVNRLGLESDYSNELSYTVPNRRPRLQLLTPPKKQVVLQITGQTGRTYEILATADLSNWSVVGTVALARNDAVNFIEANASDYLSRFYRLLEIPDTPPRLQVLILPNKQVVLRVAAQIGHSYEILATADLSNWNSVGTVTLATSDSVNLTDANAAGQSSRFYRVRKIPDTPPRLQVLIPLKKQVVLQINGRVGHTYEILATENLTNWWVIGVVTLAGSDAFRFIGSNASDCSSRFYRVREVPWTEALWRNHDQ